MNVTVVWATPLLQDVVALELAPGATLADAVRGSGFVAQYGLEPADLGFARFGVRAPADTPLAEGDRIEITRRLEVDPAVARARRARAKMPGAGSSDPGRGGAK